MNELQIRKSEAGDQYFVGTDKRDKSNRGKVRTFEIEYIAYSVADAQEYIELREGVDCED